MRITTVRFIVQTVTFGLFLAFVLLTTFSSLERFPNLRLWVGKIIEMDPLVSIATAVTTHTVYQGMLWSLMMLIPTLFLGRFFCNWICPYGSLHHVIGWAFGRSEPARRIALNQYRPTQRVKYSILIAMLVAAIFGTLQIGLLDPICLIYRSFTGSVIPSVQTVGRDVFGAPRYHQGAWLIGAILFGLVAMNLVYPRFFCRVLCPLGALLGLLSRFAWWRIERDGEKCQACGRCNLNCEGACEPGGRIRLAECLVCFNCVEDCPAGALSFAFMPTREHEVTGPDMPRRHAIFAGIIGLVFFPFVRSSGASGRNFSSKVIRPPGAAEELTFLERCLKCDQCVRVCPTNVIQPAAFEAGLEGLWSPILNFRIGHCQLNCTACGQVCPSGAIRPLTIPEKLGQGFHAARGPVRLGTAHIDPGRCLPHSKNIPCVVCEEVCPTSPKAICTQREFRPMRNGERSVAAATENTLTLRTPHEEPDAAAQRHRVDTDWCQTDDTKRYYASIQHADGVIETHRIAGCDGDTLTIEARFARLPEPGALAVVQLELCLPRIDPALCIGCGLCEHRCPVVGDRRAVYVTADGETRSQGCDDPDRNRSVYLRNRTST